MRTIGYQTIEDSGNPEIIRKAAPFLGTRSNPWLGVGYYFWDDDIDQAHKWGNDGYDGNYMICQTDVPLDNILDLHNKRSHQKHFIELLKLVLTFLDKHEIHDIPLGQAIEYLRKLNEKQKGIFEFAGIRASDFPYQKEFRFVEGRREYTFLYARIQICIFDKTACNIQEVQIIFPSKYKN